MKTIALVSCSKTKLDRPAPAKDLYQGTLFKLQRAYAEKHADEWYILSSYYELVFPDQVLWPYNRTLSSVLDYRRHWATGVYYDLLRAFHGTALWTEPDKSITIMFLAGERYRDPLAEWLDQQYTVKTPLVGLPIGKQLAWLKKHT